MEKTRGGGGGGNYLYVTRSEILGLVEVRRH